MSHLRVSVAHGTVSFIRLRRLLRRDRSSTMADSTYTTLKARGASTAPLGVPAVDSWRWQWTWSTAGATHAW